MIARLQGIVIEKKFNSLILNVNGVGYQVFMNTDSLKLKDEVYLYTHMQVKEDGHVLYGFLTEQDLVLFEQLISVKGIGCKTAIGFFQVYDASSITNAIENSDTTFLKKLPGVGVKAASQIILDLKGKVDFAVENVSNRPLFDAIDALKSLGYGGSELKKIEKRLSEFHYENSDEYIKKALQMIALGGKM